MKKPKATVAFAAVIFLISCIFGVLAPSLARTVNNDIWTGEILPESENTASLIKSNLLTAGGQRILLKNSGRPYEITITFYSFSETDINGELLISNDEPDWLSVTTADSGITVPANGTASATIIASRLDIDYSSLSDEAETEEPSASETDAAAADSEETAASETDAEETEVSVNAEEQGETPENLTFTVTFTDGTMSISGMFSIATDEYSLYQEEDADLPNGAIVKCSSFYGNDHPVYIELDGAARLRYSEDGDDPGFFPPMTRYEIGNERVMLYNGGYILVSKAGTVTLDFKYASVHGQIGLHTESSWHMLYSDELPELYTENDMFIMDDTEKALLSKYLLDDTEPVTVIEYLSKDENDELVWEETNVLALLNSEGAAVLTAYDASAGTYRINVQWIYSGQLLYSVETDVYVRRGEWQGGNLT